MTSILNKNRMEYNFKGNESTKLMPTDILQIPFDNNVYEGGDTMTFTFSSGKYFVDPQKSYLNLTVSVTGDNVAALKTNFGVGSATNLFGGVRLYHKSGTQITHNTNLDLWTKAKQYIEKDEFWFDTQGFIQGYKKTPYDGAPEDFIWITQQAEPETHSFKIKLCDLHPFFKGTDSKIFSPQIIDGLRIELDLNTKGRVFWSEVGSAEIEKYTVSANVQCALVDVQAKAADMTNDIANKRGLQWEFNDVFVTTVSVKDTQDDLTIPVEKAVSLAQNVITFARLRDSDSDTNTDSHVYLKPSGGVKWNYRIGNILYPFKRQVDNHFDTYTTLIDAFDWQYGTNLQYLNWLNYNHCYVTSLRTEDQLLSTGIYLNANKQVELQLQKGLSNDLLFHSCLEHRKVLSVNSTNSKIDE